VATGPYVLPALAGEKLDIYSAAVAVKDDSAAQRARAISKALEAVYVKASGDLRVVDRYPSLAGSIRRASTYVSSFQYFDVEIEPQPLQHDTAVDAPDTEAGIDAIQGGEKTKLSVQTMLQASFSSDMVQRSLQEAGAPLWQATRPTVLVWLVIEQGGKRHLVNQEFAPTVWAQLQVRAELRGVPIVQPLLDLEEQLLISSDDVWLMDTEKIQAASRRYNADYILVGKLAHTYSEQWLGQWLIVNQASEKAQRFTVQEQQQFVKVGVDLMADKLAQRFSVAQHNASGKRRYELQVSAVNSPEDYLKLDRYLQSIEGLGNLQLKSIQANDCFFVFESTGDIKNLDALLRLGDKLQRSSMSPDVSNRLIYRWQG